VDNFKICKESNANNNADYGESWNIGDHIGMMMDFANNQLSLTYYKNRESLGVAYSELPPGEYYPCAYLKFNETQISMLSKVDYPDI
jgi:hypothetical protein